MLKNEVLTGLLVAVFCLGLAGAVVADDGFPDSSNNPLTTTYHDNMSEKEGRSASEDVQNIVPSLCTIDLVKQNEQVAKNSCTEEDVIANAG